ncbi:hypothetical protein Sjap_019188 [Stephania japonica]|uniref:Uncharacterized protein n=1 Tax=Stephania japonica TaxID=461633 RepID=A0AAP0F775_9MAGN
MVLTVYAVSTRTLDMVKPAVRDCGGRPESVLKDREIDGLNEQLEEDAKALEHMQFQLLQERSRRSEVEMENTMLQNQVSMLMNMLRSTRRTCRKKVQKILDSHELLCEENEKRGEVLCGRGVGQGEKCGEGVCSCFWVSVHELLCGEYPKRVSCKVKGGSVAVSESVYEVDAGKSGDVSKTSCSFWPGGIESEIPKLPLLLDRIGEENEKREYPKRVSCKVKGGSVAVSESVYEVDAGKSGDVSKTSCSFWPGGIESEIPKLPLLLDRIGEEHLLHARRGGSHTC